VPLSLQLLSKSIASSREDCMVLCLCEFSGIDNALAVARGFGWTLSPEFRDILESLKGGDSITPSPPSQSP
jgi:hypothetical protein